MVLTITMLYSAEKVENWMLRLRFSSKICYPQPTDCRRMYADSVQGRLWWWQWYDGQGDDSNNDSVGDGDHSTRSIQTSRFSSSSFVSNLPTTRTFSSAQCIARKTQLLLMYASFCCSAQALHWQQDIKQAPKQATRLSYTQNSMLVWNCALIRCSSASRLCSGLHTAITAE
jgi:hypothetical protein